MNSAGTNPFFDHSSAMVTIEFISFSPLCEQLSQLTMATGYFPALKRSKRRAVTMAMAAPGFSGPLSMSACTNGKYSPEAFLSA